MEKKYLLYTIFHNKLRDDMYKECPEILKHMIFFGVNQKYEKIYSKDKGYNILNEWELPHFRPEMQKDGYCQTSALYHIYKNKLYLDYDYLGFFQYDMQFTGASLKCFEDNMKNEDKIFYLQKSKCGDLAWHGLFI